MSLFQSAQFVSQACNEIAFCVLMSHASLRRVITERNVKTEINWRCAVRKPPVGARIRCGLVLLFLPVDKTTAGSATAQQNKISLYVK